MDEAFHFGHLAVGEDADVLVLCRIHHLRGEDARRAVERREGFVKLCHLATDGGILFDDVDRKARIRDVESGLDARDAAADDQRALGNGRFPGGEGSVEMHLGDCRLAEDDRLFGADGHILMHP